MATVSAPHQLDISEADVPKASGGQVVVQIRYCGVCGTDVHGFESPELLPRAVFGHEWTGTIVDAGDGVETVGVGDRVSIAVGPPCGRCSMCRSGNADHCDTAFAEANGVAPDAPDHGGFSTHLTISERRVLKLLEGLSDEQGALVEPTALTFRAVRRSTVPLGSVVVVQGADPSGCCVPSRPAMRARHEQSSVSYDDWVTRELRLVASLAYTHQDFLGAMATLASGAVEVGPVITGTVGLSELAAVLTDLRSGSTQHAKVLLDPTR